jgi:phage gp36-like protein
MDYIAQSELEAYVQADMLSQGLDDTGGGTPSAALFASILAAVTAEIDGYLEGRYSLPLSTVPALVKSAALILCADALWVRRGADKEGNPFAERAREIRKRLERIQAGELPLQGAAEAAKPGGVAIQEPSRVFDRQGRIAL